MGSSALNYDEQQHVEGIQNFGRTVCVCESVSQSTIELPQLIPTCFMASSKWWDGHEQDSSSSPFNPPPFLPRQLDRRPRSFAAHFALLPSIFSAVQTCLSIESEHAPLYLLLFSYLHGQIKRWCDGSSWKTKQVLTWPACAGKS
jgi:hypothetical protein